MRSKSGQTEAKTSISSLSASKVRFLRFLYSEVSLADNKNGNSLDLAPRNPQGLRYIIRLSFVFWDGLSRGGGLDDFDYFFNHLHRSVLTFMKIHQGSESEDFLLTF